MKIFFLLLLGVFFGIGAYSQNTNNCQIVRAFLKDKNARKTFKFELHKELPIIFIDEKGLFKSCNVEKYYSREVKILTDTINSNQNSSLNIILYNLKSSGNWFKIEVEQKYTGAYGYIELRKVKGVFVVSNFNVGYF